MRRIKSNPMLRYIQNALLERGWWIQQVGFFESKLASLYYRQGGFSFLQIGGFDGVSHDQMYWYVQRFNGKGTVVEPLNDAFVRLVANYEWLPAVKPVQLAIHKCERAVTMYRVTSLSENTPAWALGSSTFCLSWLTDQGIDPSDVTEETVIAKHLMEVVEEQQAFSVDVLQIDAEGYDHEIIKMIDFKKFRPPIIKYERRKDSEGEGKSLEHATIELLSVNGYRVVADGVDNIAVLSHIR